MPVERLTQGRRGTGDWQAARGHADSVQARGNVMTPYRSWALPVGLTSALRQAARGEGKKSPPALLSEGLQDCVIS